MTRDIYLGISNTVDKVTGVVETSRTSVVGREERASPSHREWKSLRGKQRKESQQRIGWRRKERAYVGRKLKKVAV